MEKNRRIPHPALPLRHPRPTAAKRPRKPCQAPHSVQKPSMSHHPDKIKNPAKMHLSYAPSCTINVVGLDRKDPASKPGLSRRFPSGVLGHDSVQAIQTSPDRRADFAHTQVI